MKNRNIKVIDDHGIDRNANIMFALELEGSEYVFYWIERDEEANNVFVSKVLRNLDGTYSMINIDDDIKKKEVSEMVKTLISTAVSDQNDKLLGTTMTLSDGKNIKFIDVSFNKEQNINVAKTYVTTVKKEVTKVAENYYDVIAEENKVTDVLTGVLPTPEPVVSTPSVEVSTAVPVAETVVAPASVNVVTPVIAAPVVSELPTVPVAAPAAATTIVTEPVVASAPAPVIPAPVEVAPVVSELPTAPVAAPTAATTIVTEPASQGLVFNASKETNLNAALGEVASSATISVDNIDQVREFGEDAQVSQPVTQQPVTPIVQPDVVSEPKILTKKAGFANSKFFMVVAVAFFMASCVFLGYEVYNYFQLVQ